MKNKIVFIIISLFLIFLLGNSFNKKSKNILSKIENNGWFEVVPLDTSKGDLYDLHFITDSIGWVVGMTKYENDFGYSFRHVVGYTNNGGVSWNRTIFPGTRGLFLAFNDNNSVGLTGNVRIYRTTDNGNSWEDVFLISELINSISFIGNNIAWGVGLKGTIIKTTDSGLTWEYQTSDVINTEKILSGLSIVDSLTVYTISAEQLLFTDDGGNNWSEITIPSQLSTRFRDVKFIDKYNGWVVGDFRTILYTKDGGLTWENQSPTPQSDSFQSIDALNKNIVIATTSEGAIFRTNDGVNWEEQLAKGKYSILTNVQIINEDIAYVVGYDGIILKTTTGGVTDISEANHTILEYLLSQNYPNPFNPATEISYQIPKDGFVNLIVYNALGEVITELVNAHQTKGKYSVRFNATGLSSGVYFYKIESGNFTKVNKMLLLR